MDRTSWIGALVCLGLLFGWGWWSSKEQTKQAIERARIAKIEAAKAPPAVDPESAEPATTEAAATPDAATAGTPVVEAQESDLENEALHLNLTSVGGGIKTANLREHKKQLESEDFITINSTSEHAIGSLSRGLNETDKSTWTVNSATSEAVTYETTTADGFKLTKIFRFSTDEGADPYDVQMDIIVKNEAQTPLTFSNRYLFVGSAAPRHLMEMSMQIGAFWKEENGGFKFKTVDHYGAGAFMRIFGRTGDESDVFSVKELNWAGVTDQFFTTIVRPKVPYPSKIIGTRKPLVVEAGEKQPKRKQYAAEALLELPTIALNPGDQQSLTFDIYLGPKQFARLKGLGDNLDRAMHYDEIPIFGPIFGWAIKPLASWLIMGLVWLNGVVGNYGIAIIIITILIRLLIWPVYAKSARSMKRMAKLTPLMKEIKEKHADDPQKMNQETMKLYQTYGINPLGGCLPMFIQLPVFLAFYRMLWSAVELRHESFLWVTDLSMPDTLFTLPFEIPLLGSGFNLLPILMGVTSFIQIAITPKTGDKTQQMIFMFMPLIFVVFCYNFAAALALYWTTSNAFSILQTWLMNKMPEPELKKKAASGKKGFMARMQEQAEAAQKAKAEGGGAPGGAKSRTKMPGEKGDRHTKGKKKRR